MSWYTQQEVSWHTEHVNYLWFCVYMCESAKTYMEGKLSGEVIHAAGVHEAEGVSHGLWAQHTLACDWTEAAVGQCGSHDASALTRDLNGAQLHIWTQTQINTWIRNIIKPGCQITVFISKAFLMDFTENNTLRIWPRVCVCIRKSHHLHYPITHAAWS